MSSNFSSITNPGGNYYIFKFEKSDEHTTEKTIAYSVVLLLTIFGNLFIIITICRDNRLKLTSNFLVANMAVSDLISSLVFVPSQIGFMHYDKKWPLEGTFGEIACKAGSFIPKTSTAVSFYSCLFIAIDRYLAVAYPLRGGFSRSRLKYIIPVIWIFSALIVLPYFYTFKVVIVQGFPRCIAKDEMFFQTHFYVLLGLNLGIPLPIITALYILIVHKLHRHKTPGNQTDISRRRREQQNRKVLKMSITIVGLLSLSWVFFSISVILGMEKKNYPADLKFVAVFIAHLSYTYNFFIYLIFNDIYRENFKSMISKLFCRIRFTRVARVNIDAGITNVTFDQKNIQTQIIGIKIVKP